ncbi:hypothetical protein B0W48_04295 [Pseudoalteromonas aliena]|uniref:Cytochrome b/b6 C-terminal region profile domain-containing protein n=1 Tax=Pseudoalteromonas aliena TaxID=247523 RepID=A0A1Q2GVG2_9GAMM|nr:hypothetical protein B0W48_04295 [Pseudoalteromonas aliena]
MPRSVQLGQSILSGVIFLGYYFVGFVLMPYLAWRKYRSLSFTCIQSLISCFWASMIVLYVFNIPEGENGFVIVGMFFTIPIFSLFTQFISVGIHLIIVHFSELRAIEKGI